MYTAARTTLVASMSIDISSNDMPENSRLGCLLQGIGWHLNSHFRVGFSTVLLHICIFCLDRMHQLLFCQETLQALE